MNKSVNARSSYMKKPSEEDEMNIVTQLALQAAQGKSAESSVNIVRADIASSDDVQENSLRPALLGEFLGQQTVKENLSVFIDAARKRPDEFKKRLESFIKKTREGKIIVGYGGIDKYYK